MLRIDMHNLTEAVRLSFGVLSAARVRFPFIRQPQSTEQELLDSLLNTGIFITTFLNLTNSMVGAKTVVCHA